MNFGNAPELFTRQFYHHHYQNTEQSPSSEKSSFIVDFHPLLLMSFCRCGVLPLYILKFSFILDKFLGMDLLARMASISLVL